MSLYCFIGLAACVIPLFKLAHEFLVIWLDPKVSFVVSRKRIHYDVTSEAYTTLLRFELRNNGILPTQVCLPNTKNLYRVARELLPRSLDCWIKKLGIYCGGEENAGSHIIDARQNLLYFETQIFFDMTPHNALFEDFDELLLELQEHVGSELKVYYTHPWTGRLLRVSHVFGWADWSAQLKQDYKLIFEKLTGRQ